MLAARIALIDKTKQVSFDQLSMVASALNLQVQRDLQPIWGVSATVTALPSAGHIGPGLWPIFLVAKLPAGEGGFHLTKHNQPFAKVELGDGWTVAASHECLEMLVDPSGNRLVASNAIAVEGDKVVDGIGKFEYLVEVCDPSEDEPFSYAIDGVEVSDFYTPHYFDPVVSGGVRYSFTGAIQRPRDVLPNGYLSWFNPQNGHIEQLKNFGAPQIFDLGEATGSSLREFIDNVSRPTVAISSKKGTTPKLAAATKRAGVLRAAAEARAKMYP